MGNNPIREPGNGVKHASELSRTKARKLGCLLPNYQVPLAQDYLPECDLPCPLACPVFSAKRHPSESCVCAQRGAIDLHWNPAC